LSAGFGKAVPCPDPVATMPTAALHLRAVARAHDDVAPSNPARAVAGCNPLVVAVRAVRHEQGLALLNERQCKWSADELRVQTAAQPAERVIRIGNAIVGVAVNNDVPLCVDQAARALPLP